MSQKPRPPALDPATIKPVTGTNYPPPHDRHCDVRERRALGDAFGLSQFGVNLTRLPAGGWSAQRHWHEREDELVYVLEGEVILVTDAGRQVLRAGMAAGFPANAGNGHHLVNESGRDAVYLEIGTRSTDETVDYPDIDMRLERRAGKRTFLHRDGTPYPPRRAT